MNGGSGRKTLDDVVSLEGCDDARPSSTPLGALRLSVDSVGTNVGGAIMLSD